MKLAFEFLEELEAPEPVVPDPVDDTPMPLLDFLEMYPQYRISGAIEVKHQPRVFDEAVLAFLPKYLVPAFPYHRTGRGNRNMNNTLTHAHCSLCRRILRNDLLHWSNKNFPIGCKECCAKKAKKRYHDQGWGEMLKARRERVWSHLAPYCFGDNAKYHPLIMEMHHLRDKSALLSRLVAQLAQKPKLQAAVALVEEAGKCIPLCPNCHRKVEAGLLDLSHCEPLQYDAEELMRICLDDDATDGDKHGD